MASDNDIAEALFARCATLSVGSPALPITFPEPGQPFVEPADGKYIRADLFLNTPAWQGLSGGKMAQGLLQLTLNWPRNGGLIAPLAIVEAIKAHFPKALPLISNGTKVTISGQPWSASPNSEPDQVSFAITIPWRAV